MENKNLTAVEWLAEQLPLIQQEGLRDLIEQAKAMEKEQHQETFKQSRLAKIFEKDMPSVWESWERYYNETYNTKQK